jgi:NitT/TauT family transport system substrate-binding protein
MAVRRRCRRRRSAALLAGAAMLVLASGCASQGSAADPSGATGPSGPSGPSGAIEKPDLNVAVVPALDSAGFFVALYEGLFTKAGLHVRFIPATSSDTVIAGQVKGQYDITGGNYVSYIQAQAAGQANLEIFAEGSVMEPGTQGIYVMPNSGITSLSDLVNKTVAINAPKNILYLLTASVLAEDQLSPNAVKWVTSYPFPAMPAALKAGKIAAAVLPEPFASIAEQTDGAIPLTDLDQGATTSFPVEGYVVTRQWAQKYPNTLAAFYKALEEGQQIADSSRAAVQQAMEDLPTKPVPLAVSKQIAAVMAVDDYPFSTGPGYGVDKFRLQRVVDVMHEFLGFNASFDIGSMLASG